MGWMKTLIVLELSLRIVWLKRSWIESSSLKGIAWPGGRFEVRSEIGFGVDEFISIIWSLDGSLE